MNLGYSFDAMRGNLNSRSNSALNWSETFSYDNLDRLTDFNDNHGNHSQAYDQRGRITSNSALGNYGYSGVGYQQTELTNPTSAATAWYQDHHLQQLTFNAFKKPVSINEEGKTQLDFLYNAALQRSTMYYGSDDADKELRPMRRHYSEDGGMEITRNTITGETSFVFYLGGDAYDAPAIFKQVTNQQTNQTTNNLYYLHRDHLGSIVLITDVDGNAVEKRQFDAWGNLIKLEDGLGNPLTTFLITDRGYTGHEHLLDVGLINMNGRLYDPKLHRFLSPDNFVQDPSSTQNFNRYGYAMNNPFMYTDPTGEILWFVPLLIGAGIGILTNGIDNSINNRPFFQGALKAGVIGGLSGLASFGIGQAASSMAGFGKIAFQTVGHAYLGGFSSAVSGGDFLSGMASGALGSLAATGTGALLNNSNDFWEATGTIASGSLMGGVSSEISGGNFWDGVRNGAISSGLNHVAHSVERYIEKRQVYKFFNRLREHYEGKSGNDFVLTKKEVDFIVSKGKIVQNNAQLVGERTWRYLIDFYDSGFDLKFSFGRATVDLQLDVSSFKMNPTYFYDRYDFDPKAWGVRSIKNELITRGYNLYSSGKAFNVIYNGK